MPLARLLRLSPSARHVRSPLFFAHIRASTGTAIQQTNCHPFRYGRWLWMHNGLVHDFPRVKRDLVLAIDEGLYPSVEGSTDSEVLVHLALTFGLEQDPPSAVARMVGFVAEPLGDPEGAWNEVPESSYGVIKPGDDELHPFQPVAA